MKGWLVLVKQKIKISVVSLQFRNNPLIMLYILANFTALTEDCNPSDQVKLEFDRKPGGTISLAHLEPEFQGKQRK